jgi:3-oxoacyl-[acyl-carrier protein] reductase
MACENMETKRLANKVALVTGAGKGIGRAIALRFSDEGAKVAVNDIEFSLAKSLAGQIEKQGKESLAVKADVSNSDDVRQMFEKAVDTFGRVDILVNNAGIRRDGPFPDMPEKEWDIVLAVQLKGCFNCTRAAQNNMIQQGNGRIINISSPVTGRLKTGYQVNYASACAGVEGFTRSLAEELGAYDITVNCIAPDNIDTEMTRKAARQQGFYLDDLKRFFASEIPLKRMGTTMEVANVALFLASDEASYVTGQIIHVKGGP